MKHFFYFLLLSATCGLTSCHRTPYAYYQRTPNVAVSPATTPNSHSPAATLSREAPRLNTMEASIKPGLSHQTTKTVVLPAGTQISAQLIQPVSSQSVQSGQMIPVRVLADVFVKRVRVIKAGASGMATVQSVEKGKVPTVSIAMNSVQSIDGQNITVSSSPVRAEGKKGGIPIWAIVCAVLFVWVYLLGLLFLLVKKPAVPAELNTGTTLNGSTVSEVEIDI